MERIQVEKSTEKVQSQRVKKGSLECLFQTNSFAIDNIFRLPIAAS